jgi:hypothetical protein
MSSKIPSQAISMTSQSSKSASGSSTAHLAITPGKTPSFAVSRDIYARGLSSTTPTKARESGCASAFPRGVCRPLRDS